MLEVILVADGTVLFGAGGHPADYAVELIAYPAVGSAKAYFLALMALRLKHLFIRTDEEFELMAIETLVLTLVLLALEFLRGHEGAGEVVLFKLLD